MRVFVISPLRGTLAQLAAVEKRVSEALQAGASADVAARALAAGRAHLFEENVRLAEHLCREVALAGHAPFAPHLLYTRFLDDRVEVERNVGIASGLAWLSVAEAAWVYRMFGVSTGMAAEIAEAAKLNVPIYTPENWR